MNKANRETTNFTHYRAMVIDALGCTVAEANRFRDRISIAFDMGEPVWMIADELRLRLSAPRLMKSARELAVRVVQF